MRFRVSNARHAAAPIRRRIRLGRSASRIVEYGETALPSFSHALALRYEQAASLAGADTELLSLDSLQFDLVLRRGSGEQALEPNLQSAQAAIERAGHVAWFFPTWWAGPPALVKGFVDRTFLPGFAYRYESGRALQHKLLRGRSARLVTSMDAPWWWYALFYRSALHRSFVHATLGFVGFVPVHTTTAYGLRNASAAQRERMLRKVERAGILDAASLRRVPRQLASQGRAQAPDGNSQSNATPSAMR